jgi:hypothetical protein
MYTRTEFEYNKNGNIKSEKNIEWLNQVGN